MSTLMTYWLQEVQSRSTYTTFPRAWRSRNEAEEGEVCFPLEYLGHIISASGLHTSDKSVVETPAPRKPKIFPWSYVKFLLDLASIISPLCTLLLRKKKWIWGKSQDKTSAKLITNSSPLQHTDSIMWCFTLCSSASLHAGWQWEGCSFLIMNTS